MVSERRREHMRRLNSEIKTIPLKVPSVLMERIKEEE